MTPAQLERMRALWEGSPEMTGKNIGEPFGLSRNAVGSYARRLGWKSRRKQPKSVTPPAVAAPARPAVALPFQYSGGREPVSLFERLDALHRDMDAVLAATGMRR